MLTVEGKKMIQVTNDKYENWFPHISPDGKKLLILSYPQGTKGHPGFKNVKLRLMTLDGKNEIKERVIVAFMLDRICPVNLTAR